MRTPEFTYKTLTLLFIIVMAFTTTLKAQTDSIAFAAADTTHFSTNENEGWQLFNSYVAKSSSDSVRFELIIQHNNDIDWTIEQFVGTISDSSMIPSQEQLISFSLINSNYRLRVNVDGKCYVSFLDGDLPNDDPFIIPFKIYFKL